MLKYRLLSAVFYIRLGRSRIDRVRKVCSEINRAGFLIEERERQLTKCGETLKTSKSRGFRVLKFLFPGTIVYEICAEF